MPLLLIALLIAVFAYAWFSRRGSTLTRSCVWRQEKAAGRWRCAACGAVQDGTAQPRHCLRS
ncbi:MAG: hypothetical protein FJX28_09180 [Alphaproteobacteria bacterium]|nr:hypothetical protein [Alphaproteobacteria bacterium]